MNLAKVKMALSTIVGGAVKVVKSSAARRVPSSSATNAFVRISQIPTLSKSKRLTTGTASFATKTFCKSIEGNIGHFVTSWLVVEVAFMLTKNYLF